MALESARLLAAMKKWSRKKRWIVSCSVVLLLTPLLWFIGLIAIAALNPFHAHEHCNKNLSLSLRLYASDHEGRFPYHTNGFGDALLLLLREGYTEDVRILTAPGDNGAPYLQSLSNHTDVDESKCSRIYIQGLREATAGEYSVVTVFDAYPTRGGDHFRRPWGEPMRDIVWIDGSGDSVHENKWPLFATNQIELLVQRGKDRSEMEKLFGVSSSGIRLK